MDGQTENATEAETLTERIFAALSQQRFRINTEGELQHTVAQVLRNQDFEPREFVHLTSNDVIDMMVGRVGIELKVDGTYSMVARQLHRYAQSPEIESLILITTRYAHLRLNGQDMNNKWLRVYFLSMAAAF